MKKIIAFIILLLTYSSFAEDASDEVYEQAWKTVRKAKYTRHVQSKKTSDRRPARAKSEDIEWFDKMQNDLESDTPFDMEGSFKEADKHL
jgi:hypothetical protein